MLYMVMIMVEVVCVDGVDIWNPVLIRQYRIDCQSDVDVGALCFFHVLYHSQQDY